MTNKTPVTGFTRSTPDRQDRALTGTGGHLGFICTEGAGVGV